jgi:hypothetical protein
MKRLGNGSRLSPGMRLRLNGMLAKRSEHLCALGVFVVKTQ